MSSILNNALSGLMASRTALTTTSNNIGNANTEGYSRQRAVFADRGSDLQGGVYVGRGVNVSQIQRGYSDLINGEVNRNLSLSGSFRTSQSLLGRIDTLIAAENVGINGAFVDFFESAQDLSVRPTDIVSRNSFLSRTQNLTSRINDLDRLFNTVIDESSNGIKDSVTLINELSKQISDLNIKIQSSKSSTPGSPGSNDLSDQRDLAVQKMAEQIEINRVVQEDGSYAIFMKNGQPLVAESVAYQLQTRTNPTDSTEVQVGVNALIGTQTEFIPFPDGKFGSGRLGGLYEAQKKTNEYKNALGLVAVRLAETVNAAITSGLDQDENPGSPLFGFLGSGGAVNGFSSVIGNQFNSDLNSTLSITSIDTSVTLPKEYEVYRNSSGDMFVRERGQFVEGAPVTETPPGSGIFDANGLFEFSVSGSFANGDSFIVAPVKNAATNLRVLIEDPFQLATAGVPDIGDPFAPGDNKPILDIVELQNKVSVYANTPSSGTSLIGAFNQLVNNVGNDKRELDTNLAAQDALLNQVLADKDAFSGVNLDEEAANLIQYQQLYQAASQVISIERTLFDSFLNATR